MPIRVSIRTAAIPALLLSALTLGTFALLRDYGPEAVVRRFHQAALAGDLRGLQEISAQAPGSPSTLYLSRLIQNFERGGARLVQRRVDRRGNLATVEVLYMLPDRVQVILWVVARQDGRWRVMADETLRARF